jgi:hypothetical protein
MAHVLDMCGTVTIRRDRLVPGSSVSRLAEALQAETIDSVLISQQTVEIKIDRANRLRPGGDRWMFNLWDQGNFRLLEQEATVAVRFTLRTSWALPLLVIGMLLLTLVGWWMQEPGLVIPVSAFVILVILSILWLRYFSFPRWLQRVLTNPSLPPTRRLRELSSGGD